MMDLELANDVLITKLINHRSILRQLKRTKNLDLYTKKGQCRLCLTVCSKRTLIAHSQTCPYRISHTIQKNNRDLNQFSYRLKGTSTQPSNTEMRWFESIVLALIDLLHHFNPKRTKRAMCKFLQLNGYLIYERKS